MHQAIKKSTTYIYIPIKMQKYQATKHTKLLNTTSYKTDVIQKF